MRVLCFGLLGAVLAAQTPPPAAVLENTGRPMRLPFACSVEDIHSFGLTCPPQQPCPVYLELAGMDATGSKIVVAGNLHAESATLFSVLLASQDAGKTWSEPFERIRGAGLELVQFLDFENGWVGGESLGALPRDPFFLLTHDGGKTWYSRPVFSDTTVGAIDSFRFDSPTHGVLWIDRTQADEGGKHYATYESTTGGDSWVLRETADKTPRKGPRQTAPADWRLRADARTNAYRVERRSGAGWEPVASFLVRAGECREPEVVLAEPGPAPAVEEDTPPAAPASPAKPKPRPPKPR